MQRGNGHRHGGLFRKERKAIDSAILNDQISRYLEEGLSAKDAIKRVAKEFGIAKTKSISII